ncbi:hypothetical protein FRC03_006713 [Tulasnella sp. 419]|nr:hypothetical protein FRC03_006713 [Tulasnella sp. 419]
MALNVFSQQQQHPPPQSSSIQSIPGPSSSSAAAPAPKQSTANSSNRKRKKTDTPEENTQDPASSTGPPPRRLRRLHEACARCRSKKIKACIVIDFSLVSYSQFLSFSATLNSPLARLALLPVSNATKKIATARH